MNNKWFKTRLKNTIEYAQDGLQDRINTIVSKHKNVRINNTKPNIMDQGGGPEARSNPTETPSNEGALPTAKVHLYSKFNH